MPVINQGWNTLPLGAGGLATGFDGAPDGTFVIRTDVGNCYTFTGKLPADIADPTKKWVPLLTFASMGSSAQFWGNVGGYELVIAPTATTNFYGIFTDNAGDQTHSNVYYTTNSGGSWTKTSVSMLNADSNGNQKNAQRKIAVDPNNANVVYVGLPISNGTSFSVYRSTNGTTFTGISTATLPQTTQDPGVCGIMFDKSSGTVVGVGGLTVSKRIIIPIGGAGIYESNDGGLTFAEIAVTAMGSSAISVWNATMDFNGVYYATVINAGVGQLWRYRSGVWARLDNQTNFVPGSSWYGTNTILFADPRSGNHGYLTVSGPQGGGVGFTSLNADNATASAITWAGATGGEVPNNFAPSYDVPWLSHGLANVTNAFVGTTNMAIDGNGYCWWCGNQGMLWYFTTSDNSTPSIPNFGTTTTTYSTSVSRGTEAVVSQEVLRPPGASYPIMACQDVGIQGGTFTSYGTDYYMNGPATSAATSGGLPRRVDAWTLSYAPGNPAFVAVAATCTLLNPADQKFSGYSQSYGQIGTWTPYANQPEVFYGNTVTTNGGIVCAIDEDHHVYVPGPNVATSLQPAFTANARSVSNSWAFCTGLPSVPWVSWISYIFGDEPPSRPFAAGHGANVGHGYALDPGTAGTATLYRSTDSGANWSSFGTISDFGVAGRNYVANLLYSVPGFPNDLWASCCFVSGSSAGLWRSTNEGATWTKLSTLPGGAGAFPRYFCLGKAISPSTYPTIYLTTFDGVSGPPNLKVTLWYSTDQGATWNVVGATGTANDLPESLQLYGIKSMSGDWGQEGLIYTTNNGSGFAYYSLHAVGALVTAFRMRLHA